MAKILSKFGISELILLKIFEYQPNFGTFSAGFESFNENIVVEVVKLAKDAFYGYNRIHKQWFSSSMIPISTYQPENSIDLAIFNPSFGENILKKGSSNFFFYDFQDCINFLDNNFPKFAIFQTEVDVIPHLNTADSYVRDGFGQLSKDKLILKLQDLGYKAHLVVLDEADYGIPLHRSFAFYVATPNNFNLVMPKPLFTATGRGSYAKYRTVADAISDLGPMGEWVEYESEPKNSYQKALRNDKVQKVTWHHAQNIRSSTKKKISKVKQGSNNETSVPKSRSKGFNRAKWGSICRCMDSKFYISSSKQGDSIHPIANRPFTIREGCRIHGLPDKLSFDLSTPKKSLGTMIHNSVAPAIGEIFAMALGAVK